jgi:hypothetical protein
LNRNNLDKPKAVFRRLKENDERYILKGINFTQKQKNKLLKTT